MKSDTNITRKKNSFDRDWTQGNVFNNLLRLSWPMLVSNTLMILGPTIDMIWVGKLGSESIAGVGVAGIAVQLIMVAMMGLIQGTRAMVARFVGAGDFQKANNVAGQGFVLCVIVAAIVAAIGIFCTEAILGLFGLEAAVVAKGATYMRIQFIGQAAMAFRFMCEGIMQASGDSITPMKQALVYRLFHVAICPFLVFGWWIFPRMEISGAALASVISQTLGTLLGLWILLTGRSRIKLTLKNFHLDVDVIWRMVKIGLPALISGVQRNLSHFFLMWFMVPFGTMAVAAHSINQRIEMIVMMPAMAFGAASGVLMGQNLGRAQYERAKKSVWQAVGIVQVIMLIILIAILIWAEWFVHLFNTDPALVQLTSTFLRINAVSFMFMGLMFVLMNSLQGAGDTFPPMAISVVTAWVVMIPLAYFLPKIVGVGMLGVRWAIVSQMVVGAIAFVIYFLSGRWKHRKI